MCDSSTVRMRFFSGLRAGKLVRAELWHRHTARLQSGEAGQPGVHEPVAVALRREVPPDTLQKLRRRVGVTGDQPVPGREGVERAAGGAADADQFVLLVPVTVLEQGLQHAGCERGVTAAAWQATATFVDSLIGRLRSYAHHHS
jgi:hypothetical protein